MANASTNDEERSKEEDVKSSDNKSKQEDSMSKQFRPESEQNKHSCKEERDTLLERFRRYFAISDDIEVIATPGEAIDLN